MVPMEMWGGSDVDILGTTCFSLQNGPKEFFYDEVHLNMIMLSFKMTINNSLKISLRRTKGLAFELRLM